MSLRRLLLGNFVLPATEFVTKSSFWRLYRDMVRLDGAPRTARLDRQADNLLELLRRARSVPYWREAFAAAGVAPGDETADSVLQTLRALPFTTKDLLRGRLTDMLAEDGDKASWQYTNSAGTTSRITVVYDFEKRDYGRAAELRALLHTTGMEVGGSAVEIPPDACNIMCGFEDPGPQGFYEYLTQSILRREVFEPETISNLRGRFERQIMHGRETLEPINPAPAEELCAVLDQRIDRIYAQRPFVVRGLPIYLVWLAERAAARGIRIPSLKWALPYGGLMSPMMRQRVERGFGVPFRDTYGTGELGPMAASCAAGNLHVFEDLYVIEILDADGQPVPPDTLGEIVVTDLKNHSMPMVRYRVGDMGMWVDGACPCGDASPRLRLDGRIQEMLGVAGGEPLCARELDDIMFGDPGVWNFRVEQRGAREFSGTVVAAPHAQPDLTALTQRLRERLRLDTPPRLRLRPFIRPEESGKYRAALVHQS